VIVEAIEMDQQLHVALEAEQRVLRERVEGREKDASAHKPVVHQLVLLGVSGFAIVASRPHGAKRHVATSVMNPLRPKRGATHRGQPAA
jgi:hypothetical protein